MKNDPLKILVLHSDDQRVEHIKQVCFSSGLRAVFLVADSKESLFQRLAWMCPDIIISDLFSKDFSGLEAWCHIQQQALIIPFVYVVNIPSPVDKLTSVMLEQSDGWLNYKDLDRLPQLIRKLFFLKGYQDIKQAEQIETQHQIRTMLCKVLAMLERTEDFEEKAIITDYLNQVEEKINFN